MAGKPRERTEAERERAMAAVKELIHWIGDRPERQARSVPSD